MNEIYWPNKNKGMLTGSDSSSTQPFQLDRSSAVNGFNASAMGSAEMLLTLLFLLRRLRMGTELSSWGERGA